jgi:soluble lytic murein transglycosylase
MRRFLLTFLLATSASAQSPLTDAEAALRAGRPWRTTQLLAPVLANPKTRTPDAVILAAQAAAAWQGWGTVTRLLAREPWLDTQYDRLGRRLLAEAAVGEGRARDAVNHGLVSAAGNSNQRTVDEQGRRLLVLARAYDRLNVLDSAAARYLDAAQRFPTLRDWLALRAAAVTTDSTDRKRIYAALTLPGAAGRAPRAEAIARERSGDTVAAIIAYTRLGARGTALRLRWQVASDNRAKLAVREELLAMLGGDATTATSREALDVLDLLKPPLDRDHRLLAARRAAALGRATQSVTHYLAAAKDGALGSADRLRFGTALGDIGRWPEAAEQFRGVTEPSLAGHAAYYGARALLRSNDGGATPALERTIRDFPGDTLAASNALYLLGDLALDRGAIDSARSLFRRLVTRYPSSAQFTRSLILASLMALEAGDATTAARDLGTALSERKPTGVNGDALRYWRGRALMQAGDTNGGKAALRELLDRGPESYYAVRAAERLDTLPWEAPVHEATPIDSATRAAFERAALLDTLGMGSEAGFELDRLSANASGAEGLLRAAEAFAAYGYAQRAAQLASRALTAGAPRDGTLWQLIYPLPYESRLRETAMSERVDPLLAASVIRQESGFEPRATSGAGARGLMQMMPANAPSLGRALGFPEFDAALLWVPDVNLAFGMRHFAGALGRYPEPERALAAYNAGGTRVDRWSQATLRGIIAKDQLRAPIADAEIFVERIPYDETRGYVRAVVRNLAMYRMIYGR